MVFARFTCVAIIFSAVIYTECLQPKCNFGNCISVMTNKGPANRIEFSSLINQTDGEINHIYNWVWAQSNTTTVWDVLFKEEQITGNKSGRNVFLHGMNIIMYINWIYSGNNLSWSSTVTNIPEEIWNLTLCHKNYRIAFKGTKTKWLLTIGTAYIDSTVGTSGSIEVGPTFLAETQPAETAEETRLKRSPQKEETEVVDDDKKNETVWNRLKGYFRELFDRGPNDQRGWLTRVADWILGFLERLLT